MILKLENDIVSYISNFLSSDKQTPEQSLTETVNLLFIITILITWNLYGLQYITLFWRNKALYLSLGPEVVIMNYR